MKDLQPFVSESSPANARDVRRSATASCQDIVVMVRMLSGDRGHVKKVQEKGIVAKQALAKSCKKAFFLCT
jgi:hypothetical protein